MYSEPRYNSMITPLFKKIFFPFFIFLSANFGLRKFTITPVIADSNADHRFVFLFLSQPCYNANVFGRERIKKEKAKRRQVYITPVFRNTYTISRYYILSVIGSQLRHWCAVITRSKIKLLSVFFIFHLVYQLYLIGFELKDLTVACHAFMKRLRPCE